MQKNLYQNLLWSKKIKTSTRKGQPKTIKQINFLLAWPPVKCSTIDRRPPFSLFLLQTIFLEQALASRGVEWPAEQNCPFGRNISKHPATSAPCKRWVDTCSCLQFFSGASCRLRRGGLNVRWARAREQQPIWPEPAALANIANIRTMESRKRSTHHLVSDLEISEQFWIHRLVRPPPLTAE